MLAELLLRKPLFPGSNRNFLIIFLIQSYALLHLFFSDIEQLKLTFKVLGTTESDELDWIKTPEARRWVEGMKKQPGKDLEQLFSMTTPDSNFCWLGANFNSFTLTVLVLDLVIGMLNLDPTTRVTAQDALEHEALAELYDADKEVT